MDKQQKTCGNCRNWREVGGGAGICSVLGLVMRDGALALRTPAPTESALPVNTGIVFSCYQWEASP